MLDVFALLALITIGNHMEESGQVPSEQHKEFTPPPIQQDIKLKQALMPITITPKLTLSQIRNDPNFLLDKDFPKLKAPNSLYLRLQNPVTLRLPSLLHKSIPMEQGPSETSR